MDDMSFTNLPFLQSGSHTRTFWSGVQAELPLLVGVFPFGMIYGALALKAGMSHGAAQSMSTVLFAGSSQFLAAQMAAAAAPSLVIILAVGVINLRHALYSASVAPYIQKLSTGWKMLLAYLLTDECYAVVITHYELEEETPNAHWYFLGAGVALWSIWQISTALGIFLGAVIPPQWPLDFALPLTFIAMVVPVLKDRASLGAALAAGAVGVLTFSLPYKLSIITAALVGILVGLWLEKRQ
jgi:4-azaleucine resistance transporter AzlC